MIRNAIAWVGLPDPGKTREELRAKADSKLEQLQLLIAGWQEADPNGEGMTVNASIDLAYERSEFGSHWRYPTLRAALESFRWPKASAQSIGKQLRKHGGRIVSQGDKRVRMTSFRDIKNTTQWRVETAN